MHNAKKVLLNTIFIYGKVIISLLLALISTRLIFNSLGKEDFGIFNLLAGIIIMLSFLNGAMTITSQRYLSYYIGKGESEKNKDVFRTSVTLHLLIGILITLFLVGLKFFLFDGMINIPFYRVKDAEVLYLFMIISTFFTITAVPYDALINAHEDLFFDSILGIIESVLKLVIALYIQVTSFDKLIVFGLLISVLTIVIRITKTVWCLIQYPECKLSTRVSKNWTLFKEMFSYSLWNLFGSICYVAHSQGFSIILNRFFGIGINSTYAISNQVNSQMISFSSMLVKAFNPQIVKSEGSGDRNRMIRLAIQSSKFSVFLVLIMVIPLIIEMPFVLKIWLINTPEYAVSFCSIILISTLISQMSSGLKTAIQATGNIRLYQGVVGTTILLNLPIAIFLLYKGFPAYSVMLSSLIIEIISFTLRLKIVSFKTGLSISIFMNQVVYKVLTIGLFSSILVSIPHFLLNEGFLRLILVICIGLSSTSILIWIFGFSQDEKNILIKIIRSFTKKKKFNMTKEH
jgi:O-antigen/teichoic acid export membrane protein